MLKARSAADRLNLGKILFERQLPFGEDDAAHETGVCSRRAGKTFACAVKLLKVAKRKAGCVALYITLSRLNAKRIIWKTLKELNAALGLGGMVSEADLSIEYLNGSVVYLSGAVTEKEIEKFRGMPFGIVIVDESQAFPDYLEGMVDEVLAPGLMDFDGSLVLIGTPGPVPVGYFHDCVTRDSWSHHQWTVFDNPHIFKKSGKTPQQHLEKELARRGVTVDDPVIQREWFGRWVLDVNALVFRYDKDKNDFAELPPLTDYVIGVDMGFDDADAIAVLGWHEHRQELYLVEEWVAHKQGLTPLAAELEKFYAKYSPQVVVADTGGLGKKIAQELTERTKIPIEAAEKERKLEHIELLNDALRTGRLFAQKRSRFAQDAMLVEWDRKNPEKPKISSRFHSDMCDAVLYAYRQCQHWLSEAPPAKGPARNTTEWLEQQAAQGHAEVEAHFDQLAEDAFQQQHADRPEDWL